MQDWKAEIEPLVDNRSPTPLYHQVFLVLKEKIRRGEIDDQALLPSEMQLSDLFNVSRITIKRALSELAAEGLVSRRRGIGTYANAPAAAPPLVNGSFDNWIESVDALGRTIEVELLSVVEVETDASISTHLDLPIPSKVQRVVRLRKVAGKPFAHVVAYIPADIAAGYPASALEGTPMLALLERAGARPAEAEQWISAVIPAPAIAAALDIAGHAPALKLEQVMREQDGRPVQYLRVHYHAERFHYHVRMDRRAVDAGTYGDTPA